MNTLQDLLKNKAAEIISKVFENVSQDADVTHCQNESFGHYQINNALKLAKVLKQNPRVVAQKLIDEFLKDDFFKKNSKSLEIAGPGFINIKFKNSFISKVLNEISKDKKLGFENLKKEKIIVEFSSPNIAKELHVGHLRSTIIGDSIANLFEFLDQDVLRLNHIGDWGTQFGMLISYMKDFAPDVLKGCEKADLTELTKWYKAAKKLFDENEEFKKKSQLQVVALQSGEKDAKHSWKIICDISRIAFEEIYNLLNIKVNERGESYYNPFLSDVVKDLEKKNLIEISDGAKCVFIEGFKTRDKKPLPVIVQKSDGGFNYDTTDIAAFKNRCFDEKSDRIIVVTDAGQSLHFQMVYALCVKAKYIDPKKTRFDHVTFGLVLGSDGKKFKTRSGKTEKLIDLLQESISRAKKIILIKNSEISEVELEKLAKVIGIGAIKYSDLSSYRLKDYQFSYDKMLKFEGNTYPFLLYSYVRIKGIKRKLNEKNIEKILKEASMDLNHQSEIFLALHIARFLEIVQNFSKDLLPNRLCDYLYELADKFNAFFRDCQVIGSKDEKSRLLLCDLTSKVFEKGFKILGLETVDRM